MTESPLLFAYGSLKRGFAHHDLMAEACFVSETETASGYYLVLLGEYPALVEGGQDCVRGELYQVGPELLARLDQFEGSDYERHAVRLVKEGLAEAYFSRVSAAGLRKFAGQSWDHR
jgi:gamma-glutamylcyclotransferase (GGCT)/AIG2-like uncharacterized protein YtfP